MPKVRRKCRLANSEYRDVDLRRYRQIIIDTINETVAGKNPEVYRDHFSTDSLEHKEAVAVGRALAKIPGLKRLGKEVTIFRLFDGQTCKCDENDDEEEVENNS